MRTLDRLLVKLNQNRGRQEIDRLGRGGRHLLALATSSRSLGLGLLAVVLPEARVHIRLNGRSVGQNVLQDALLDRPPEEVQLAHSGLLDGRGASNDEADPIAAAEGVEQLLAVGLELTLVLEVDDELALLQGIGDIELLGVVGHEPLNHAETHGGRAGQKGQDRLDTARLVVELLEPADNIVLFALDAVLEGVARGLHPC